VAFTTSAMLLPASCKVAAMRSSTKRVCACTSAPTMFPPACFASWPDRKMEPLAFTAYR
jgi:hypothetical protein